jgi:hypothetical protein
MLISNAAQPGIWNAGGSGYHLLYPSDSLNFKRIQMQSENISVKLYQGFAVVKGEYFMFNDTEDTIKVKVGYPINGIFEGNSYGKLNQVSFDGLYKLKTKQNGIELSIIETPVEEDQLNTTTFENDNWYVWENVFLPDSTTKIEVLFIVNTNNARIREGYKKDEHNAFVYLLESGSVWKQPIVKGDFKVSLSKELQLEDIHGATDMNWEYDQDSEKDIILYASRTNFSPTPKDNIVFNYGEKIDDFNFDLIIENTDHYFDEIERISTISKPDKNLIILEVEDPYKTSESYFGYFLILFGLVLLTGIFFFLRWLIRTMLRKRSK